MNAADVFHWLLARIRAIGGWLLRLTWPRLGIWIAIVAAVAGAFASRFGRTGMFLDSLDDAPVASAEIPLDTVSRIADIAAACFEDAYANPETAIGWMDRIRGDFRPLSEYLRCSLAAREGCEVALEAEVLPPLDPSTPPAEPSIWGLPASSGVPGADAAETGKELDAERLVSSVEELAAPLLELHHGLPHHQADGHAADPNRDFDEAMLQEGIEKGLLRAAGYIGRRTARRDPKRPITALVMSGGAGNGAFSAGFVSRLLEVMARCRVEGSSCRDARIDLAIGTSAGALIGTLVDMFFTKGQEKRAMQILEDEFTCGVSSDLYCRNDAWLTGVFLGDVKGLVTFDGLGYLLRTNLSRPLADGTSISTAEGMDANDVELVTMSLDANSGHLFSMSDQDPEGVSGVKQRMSAVLASAEEPGLASFESEVERSNGDRLRGTLIDGGVISPIPVLEAVRRGAERTVVVSNWTREQAPEKTKPNGIGVLLRSLEIQTTALAQREMELADIAAQTRRMTEYHVCSRRFALLQSNAADDVARFCERRFTPAAQSLGKPHPASKEKRWLKRGTLPWVESSWQSTWVHRSENTNRPAVGYSFDPKIMQPLYLDGIAEYQQRCRDIHAILGLSGPEVDEECPPPPENPDEDPFVKRAAARLHSIDDCRKKLTRRLCF